MRRREWNPGLDDWKSYHCQVSSYKVRDLGRHIVPMNDVTLSRSLLGGEWRSLSWALKECLRMPPCSQDREMGTARDAVLESRPLLVLGGRPDAEETPSTQIPTKHRSQLQP